MDKMILKMSRHNIQTVTVTQNLSDLKNTGNETVNAIIENCTAYISLVNCNDKMVPCIGLWVLSYRRYLMGKYI